MTTRFALSTLALAATIVFQTGCAQALSPIEPDHRHINHGYGYTASRHTQTLQTIGSNVRLSIKDRSSGSRLSIYQHGGEYWVVGAPGQGYAINFQSVFNRRVLATTSVDGINIITGEAAGYVQRGYILSPRGTYDVTGWRKNEHEVAAFNFARPEASYAAQTGRPTNVGVIGVAVFPELFVPPVQPAPPIAMPAPVTSGKMKSEALGEARAEAKKDMTSEKASANVTADSSARAPAPAAPSPGLGTQHGARESSYSPISAFRRESNTPMEVIQLRYDTAENLVARGVLQWVQPAPRPYHQPRPQSFPSSGSYVPDPK